jgi:hypothetical protein
MMQPNTSWTDHNITVLLGVDILQSAEPFTALNKAAARVIVE